MMGAARWRAALAGLMGLAAMAMGEAQADAPLLNAMFQDHGVLQRDQPINVWGEAPRGARVTVSLDGASASARADRDGKWSVRLRAHAAGGPYTLEARASNGTTQSLSDVMVGDVFLCSGQSNMEYSVAGSLSAGFEIARSANDNIRLLQIAHSAAPAPLAHFEAAPNWVVAGPETVGSFSAACYFMARDLEARLHVPMGLINASWGGSNIETWITERGLRGVGGFNERLDLLNVYARDPHDAYQRMGALWMNWWKSAAPDAGEPWMANAGGDWRALPLPMRDWKKWGVPETANLNGMVWFRKVVTLTAAQAAQGATLSLGGIDEVDQTWVNGQPIANSFGWGTERVYDVPAGVLHEGENAIVVNVLSTWDMGGMYGPPEHMMVSLADGSSAPIGEGWQYELVPQGVGYPPRAPWESIGGLTSLNNAMIAPMGPYGVRAVAWYQGESNTGAASNYAQLLSALMSSWRGQFGADVPFLIVQLPNFGPAPTHPVASGWADLREAQRRAVEADAHAGLAVTIDVGDRDNLHPQNKQAVGARLARAARHVVYGEAVSPSGPWARSATRLGDDIVVQFSDFDGGLAAYSAKGPMAFELCGDSQESCRYVEAGIAGDHVAIASDGAPASRVRYCWGEGPVCNLYDGSGLPAGPFELNIQ